MVHGARGGLVAVGLWGDGWLEMGGDWDGEFGGMVWHGAVARGSAVLGLAETEGESLGR